SRRRGDTPGAGIPRAACRAGIRPDGPIFVSPPMSPRASIGWSPRAESRSGAPGVRWICGPDSHLLQREGRKMASVRFLKKRTDANFGPRPVGAEEMDPREFSISHPGIPVAKELTHGVQELAEGVENARSVVPDSRPASFQEGRTESVPSGVRV